MFTTHGYKYHTSSNSSLVQVEIRRFTLFQLNLGAQIRLLDSDRVGRGDMVSASAEKRRNRPPCAAGILSAFVAMGIIARASGLSRAAIFAQTPSTSMALHVLNTCAQAGSRPCGLVQIALQRGAAAQRFRARSSLTMVGAGDEWEADVTNEQSAIRDFRANMVLRETLGTETLRKKIPAIGDSHWAYSAEGFVEPGSFLLWGAEEEMQRKVVGLHQQYMHKAVILIVEDESNYTKGVIINRKTNHVTGKGWPIWFGGEVEGLATTGAKKRNRCAAICLHKLNSPAVQAVSTAIISGFSQCSLLAAETLVEQGHAHATDFRTIAGYVGWNSAELLREIPKRWHVVTASPTLMTRLLFSRAAAFRLTDSKDDEPRFLTWGPKSTPAIIDHVLGLTIWNTLMKKIGLASEQKLGSFEHKMLIEWGLHNVALDAEGREYRNVVAGVCVCV